MRRAVAAPTIPVEPFAVPALARVERGPRGLRLAPAGGPGGGPAGPPLRLEAAAPVAVRELHCVAGGALVLAVGPGVAYSLATPQMRVVHDRRPPGLDRAAGAPAANAGLLRADGGWRAVVLPSLGDLAAGLGPGPVALRADGRRLAAQGDGGIEEWDVGAEEPAARHEGTAACLCYASDGRLVAAAGAGLGPPGTEAAEGSPIEALAAAAGAPRVAALHADGTVSLWDPERPERLAAWPAPLEGPLSLGISADGEAVALGTPAAREPAAVLARAADGTVVRRVEGARAISPSPAGGGMAIGGDWGSAWLKTLEEDA